ncbi:MAG: hypothetical protein ACREIB_09685 [Pseudomonadota bacterium]
MENVPIDLQVYLGLFGFVALSLFIGAMIPTPKRYRCRAGRKPTTRRPEA